MSELEGQARQDKEMISFPRNGHYMWCFMVSETRSVVSTVLNAPPVAAIAETTQQLCVSGFIDDDGLK